MDERTQQLKAAQNQLVQSDRLATLGQSQQAWPMNQQSDIRGSETFMLLERLMASGNYPVGREAEFRKYLGLISA